MHYYNNHFTESSSSAPWSEKETPNTCPMCESENIEYFDIDETGTVYKCLDCGEIFNY